MKQNISEKIISTYEGNLNKLGRYKLHWLIRMYRTTGNKRYLPLIFSAINEAKPKILKDLKNILEGTKSWGEDFIATYKVDSPRKVKRIVYYKKHPEVLSYMRASLNLFIIKSLHLEKDPSINKIFNQSIRLLKSEKINRYFLDEKLIAINPSLCANIIFNSFFLGISDQREEFLKKSEKYWGSFTPKDISGWLDKVYALTHIIIGASDYYQHFIERKNFDWVFRFFEEDIPQILKGANPDTIGEVALCFKLIKDFKNPVIGKVKSYLAEKFDEKAGFIVNERKPGIVSSEHRNIIAVMVFDDFDSLTKGPNLRDFIHQKNR